MRQLGVGLLAWALPLVAGAAPLARPESADWLGRAQSAFGILGLIGIGVLLSKDRRRIPWRVVGVGTLLQLLFALIVLKSAPGRAFFAGMNDAIVQLLGFSQAGADFLFRSFVTGKVEPGLVAFAFNVLPTIVFFSALMTVLYHLGIVQRVVAGLAWLMQRTMKTSGAETLSTAGNIFLGQSEAPLLIRPYLAKMTESELFCVMVGGMSSTAGGVLAAYVGMLKGSFPDIAGHLLAASVLSGPATLVFAKLLIPEREVPETAGVTKLQEGEKLDANVIDAAARGSNEGLSLAFNIAAMLIAFIALIALLNAVVGWAGGLAGVEALSLQKIAGWLFWPLAFLMGVPPSECATIGGLLGEKTVINEFVAYAHLGELLASGTPLSYRAVTIASYALSGFANFASIAIQVGGIGALVPSRRADLARLGLRAVVGGSLASFQTAAIAGLLL